MNAPQKLQSTDAAKHVGIWIRVSTEDQARGESPEHHERRARAYAEAKGWDVREVYHLEGVSGKTVMHHAEAQRMLKDIKKGHIQGLVFSKLARLARNTKELLEFADIFRQCNCDLISLGESIDTSTPAGRLFYTMIAAMAAWEREEIAARVAVTVPIRAKLGKPMGGAAPFGYQWKDKKIVIDPVEGPIRRQVFELFAKHQRKKIVATLLNEAGHRTRANKPFDALAIRRILADPISKGTRRVNYTTVESGKIVLKPERDWMNVEVPAIVSPELWEECRRIWTNQRSSSRPVAKRRIQLFGGVTWCACGMKMYARSNTPKYVCEKCRRKIPIVDLDAIFHEQLKYISISPAEVAAHLSQTNEGLKLKEDMIQTLTTKRQQLASGMDRVFNALVDGQISSEAFANRYKPMEDQCKQMDEELPRLQAEIDFMKITAISRDDIVRNARDLYTRWPSLTHEEKRQITEALAEKIVVGDGEIDVTLYHLPGAPSSPPKDGKMGSKPLSLAPANRAFLASSTAI